MQRGLAAEDPLRTLRPLNARADRKRLRRALSQGELQKLLAAASAGPERFGLSGRARGLVYRFAAESGLRAGEVRSLCVGDFCLDPERPSVTIRAGHAKNRQERTLPLKRSTAVELGAWLSARLPAARAFPLPERTSAMLRADLEAAGLPYRDESGRVADFHALRVSMISALARAGVAPRIAQSLARHSSFAMTFDTYAKLGPEDEARALDALPDLSPEPTLAVRATGTDGATESQSDLASHLADSPSNDEPRGDTPSAETASSGPRTRLGGSGGGSRTPDTRIMIPLLYQLSYTAAGGGNGDDTRGEGSRQPGPPVAISGLG